MDIRIFPNHEAMTAAAADAVAGVITRKPDALICLAAGHTPVDLMKRLVVHAREGKFPKDRFRFISLDEWVGLGPKDSGSCIHDVGKYFLDDMGLERGARMFFFDGLAKDMQAQIDGAKAFLAAHGPIDVIVLGIGMNGHIGFNEVGSAFDSDVRVLPLDETSKTVGAKYFDTPRTLESGITIGMRQILEAKKAFLLASSAKKADIVRQALKDPPTERVPASVLQKHPAATAFLDAGAAAKLNG